MKKIQGMSLLVLGILTTNIYASSDNYIGLGYSHMTYGESGFEDVNPSSIFLKYGKELNQNFAFEVRGAVGVSDDTLKVNDIVIDVDCNNMLGIYGVGKKYLTKDFSLNGIIGLTRAKFTSKSTNGVVGTTVENYEVECFETEMDMSNYLKDHRDDVHITTRIIYSGKLYGIPEDIKNLFNDNLLVQIKKLNFNDVQAIIILK